MKANWVASTVLAGLLIVSSGTLWAENMKTYYPNGKVQLEVSDTSQKMYYDDGKLMSEFTLKDGSPAGVGKSYYPTGKLMREDDFDKKHWKQYDDAGHILAEGDL